MNWPVPIIATVSENDNKSCNVGYDFKLKVELGFSRMTSIIHADMLSFISTAL